MKKPPRNDQVRDGLWIPQRTTETKGTTVSILPEQSTEVVKLDLSAYPYRPSSSTEPRTSS